MNAIFCLYNRRIIGVDGLLPSQVIPELGKEEALKVDMSIFKYLTRDAIVVMGRKTWESLGCKQLPGRKMNIIITSTPDDMAKKYPLWKFKDPVNFLTKEQFERWHYANEPNVWIIGGISLLKEYIPRCEHVYCNEIICSNKYELDKIESSRLTIFDASELCDILNDNNFIEDGRKDLSLMAKSCFYPQTDATLYCYHFYKHYLNGWNYEGKSI